MGTVAVKNIGRTRATLDSLTAGVARRLLGGASFAEWLADVAEEVNVAVALGGSLLKGKWVRRTSSAS